MSQLKRQKLRLLVVLNLVFTNNTILSCFLFFFFIIDLYFLIPAFIAQIFKPTAELVIPLRIPTEGARAKIETHPVTADAKKSSCSI